MRSPLELPEAGNAAGGVAVLDQIYEHFCGWAGAQDELGAQLPRILIEGLETLVQPPVGCGARRPPTVQHRVMYEDENELFGMPRCLERLSVSLKSWRRESMVVDIELFYRECKFTVNPQA